ncbi:MAG: hypothetical protein ACPGQM_10875 [Alphaproteobacteria bacterium]
MINTVRPYALTLSAGALAALLFAVPFAFGIGAAAPLTLTGIPLMAAGLGIGVIAAAGAGLTGLAVGTGIVLALALGPEPSFLFAILFAAPIVFAVHMLGRSRTSSLGYIDWQPPLTVMAWLLAAAIAVMIIFGLIVIKGDTDLLVLTRTFLQATLTGIFPEMGLFRIRSMVTTLSPVFPGAVLAVWMLLLAVSTAGAIALLHNRGALGRPTPHMEDLRTPLWVPVVFIVALLIAWLGDGNYAYLGQNAAIAIFVPLFLVGVGTFHAIARRTPITIEILAVFYGFLIVFPPLSVPVALIGVADKILGLRRRTGLVRSGQEV